MWLKYIRSEGEVFPYEQKKFVRGNTAKITPSRNKCKKKGIWYSYKKLTVETALSTKWKNESRKKKQFKTFIGRN